MVRVVNEHRSRQGLTAMSVSIYDAAEFMGVTVDDEEPSHQELKEIEEPKPTAFTLGKSLCKKGK